MLSVIGYQLGDSTKVAWMEYFDLIFAYFFQWIAFNIPPNKWEWIGLACLLATCIIHILEEIIKYKQVKQHSIHSNHKYENDDNTTNPNYN